jgi:drug/metabolite transporter (DMT)-like permease
MDAVHRLLLPAASAVAGATFVLIEIAGRSLPAATVAEGRAGIGWLTLRLLRGDGEPAGRLWHVHLVAFWLMTAPFFLLAYGQQRIPAALAAVLVATVPLITAALAPFVLRGARWQAGEIGALSVGLLGVVLTVGGAAATLDAGVAAVLAAALGFAVGGLLAKRLLAGRPLSWASSVLGAAALQLLPAAVLAGAGEASASSLAALAVLGAVGTGGVFYALFALVERDGPTRAALLDYGAPAFGVLYAALLLGERLGSVQVAGMALVASACALHVALGAGMSSTRTEAS